MTTSTHSSSTSSRGFLIGVLSAAILSTTAIFIRYLTQNYHMPALVLAFWRDVFVSLTLLPFFVFFRPKLLRIRREHLLYLLLYGLMLAVFNALWTISVAMNGAAIATVLVYSSVGFTALLGWWILKERPGWAGILGALICLIGCVLVSGAESTAEWLANPLGILTGILSGLWYAIYSLMGRSASQRGLNPWTTLFYIFSFAAVFLLFGNLIPGGPLPGSAVHVSDLLWLGKVLSGWGVLFLLAAGPTVAGYGLYIISLSNLPTGIANLLMTLEPVFTALIAFFLLGELLDVPEIIGCLMIMAGAVFIRVYQEVQVRRAQRKASLAVPQ